MTATKVVQPAAKPKPPNAGKGRVAGVPNKTTALLKDAILLAAKQAGDEIAPKAGLVGYLKFLAATEPRAFASLLGRVLPLQVVGDPDHPLVVKPYELTDAQLAAIASNSGD